MCKLLCRHSSSIPRVPHTSLWRDAQLTKKGHTFTVFLYQCTEVRVSYKGKGKAVPLQAWTAPEGSRKLRFPQDGGKVVSLTHRPPLPPGNIPGIARSKRDGTRAETRFGLSAKRTSPFKSTGVSVQSTAGSRGVRISVQQLYRPRSDVQCNTTGYTLHSHVSPSLPLPCVNVCHQVLNALYSFLLEAETTPRPQCDRKDFISMKNPLTPAGIEPATFRFVAQHLNHCATAVPRVQLYKPKTFSGSWHCWCC